MLSNPVKPAVFSPIPGLSAVVPPETPQIEILARSGALIISRSGEDIVGR